MSPASKSKSKDKKAGKEHQKASSKPSGPANAGSGMPGSAYNPLSGTFHALEIVSTSSTSPQHANGRYQNIDETDDHLGCSLGAGVEYDSVSNNGSWSGESEDHKEKNIPIRQETIPGADNDKREKTRQKNERKHQRQKERRVQELHERCSGYLMSRKLEALAQQLVVMGFSHEQATVALILNDGKVEESVSWLFEGGEDADKRRDKKLSGANLKIDISGELARMADMEIRYKCNKQEVERAVVASEGDLEKAAESLSELKLDPPAASLKPEETGDPPTVSNGKLSVAVSQNVMRQQQQKANPPSMIQQRRDDRDFNYTKTAIPVVGSPESGNKNLHPLNRIQSKMEWLKPPRTAVLAEKRWPSAGTSPVSYSLASPLQVSTLPSKTEARFVAVDSEYKNLHPGTVMEPVIMMQRPQSANAKQVPATSISSSPPGTANSWYSTNSFDIVKSNGSMPHIPTTRSHSPNNLNSNKMFHQHHFQQQQHFIPGSSPGDSPGTNRGNGLWNRTVLPPTLAAASSLGLFTGLGGSAGSSGASSPVDWSTAGSMARLDYSSIDWSLDRGLSSPRASGLWMDPGYLKHGTQIYDSSSTSLGAKLDMRTAAIGNGVPIPGLQDGEVASAETSAAKSHEWTSPFEGKDLFTLPRQFVSSPSL
ncbi:hypothetical protein P3X46_015568 [Hevea brasiliensis]|uniref:UBA domain-containing protein n=1 Tax=Hevea brasiliensis TaxID=3981 RepID=A0ABQ9LWD6_HEVBR|nr:uncharacterized protein LOC110653319 [Hevea brasiliensis]XP_021664588.2 uncharacterized protein LOC110653319 [Hevea brasiliensis]KAJ9172319.1 hypothetical protein P3X46_015568 [Hevea brasiliensis]